MEAWENDEWACSKNKSQGAVSCNEKQRVAIMTNHAKAIEAGARAMRAARGLYGGPTPSSLSDAQACIEAAIASGELVPASAVAEMRERLADAVWFAIDPSFEGIARIVLNGQWPPSANSTHPQRVGITL